MHDSIQRSHSQNSFSSPQSERLLRIKRANKNTVVLLVHNKLYHKRLNKRLHSLSNARTHAARQWIHFFWRKKLETCKSGISQHTTAAVGERNGGKGKKIHAALTHVTSSRSAQGATMKGFLAPRVCVFMYFASLTSNQAYSTGNSNLHRMCVRMSDRRTSCEFAAQHFCKKWMPHARYGLCTQLVILIALYKKIVIYGVYQVNNLIALKREHDAFAWKLLNSKASLQKWSHLVYLEKSSPNALRN